MCGIAGLIRFGERSEENIERMKERMLHRGPDAGGTWKSDDGEVVLGHRRLAIVDLSETGAQPMLSHSGRFAMVYNGEIYNHRELRQRLLDEKKVSAFRGTSDSEVMLEAFEAYGTAEALQFMKGMFAVALYDREEKKLQLFRDRIGEKPLYYGFVSGSSGGKAFAFASDLGCIACLDGFDLPVEQGVLPIYFTHGYIPAPYTIYKGIRKLTPGRILTIRAPFTEAEISEETYWSVEEAALRGTRNPFKGSFEEASQELERLMRASIRDQMVADVPVGAFLSAGIDSSTIVSLMQAESPGSVRSFTIGMEDP
ncbi:MAG: asparagine synthase (glutamine-hydrolyzing), partial [Lachnospiraceae bacterium]|nr:asparagine synthase (glutamine-hydrolyzing) [Lachnospiraceae bacterium]